MMEKMVNSRSSKPIDIKTPNGRPVGCFSPDFFHNQSSYSSQSASPQLASSLNLNNNSQLLLEKCCTMKENEVTLLRKSFNSLIPHASEIGLKGVKRMFDKVPECLDIFSKRNIRKGDQWELMNHGLTLLNGVERVLFRLDRPTALVEYVRHLQEGHRDKYYANSSTMSNALVAFQGAIMEHLALVHDHDVELQHCDICRCWIKFFDIFRDMIVHPPPQMGY